MLIPVSVFHVGSEAPAVGFVTAVELAALLWHTNTTTTSLAETAFVHVTDGFTALANTCEYWFCRVIAADTSARDAVRHEAGMRHHGDRLEAICFGGGRHR